MICTKCNHRLPDDSEFCQYCGNRVEEMVVQPVDTLVEEPDVVSVAPVVEDEPNIDDMTPDEALNAILEMQAKETVRSMEANSQSQPDNENDADFGLVPNKPIFTFALMSVNGEREYLDKLYTSNGEKIKYNRRGSMSVDGINGMIDVYDTYLPSGQPYKTIYINMYGAEMSAKAPVGFILSNEGGQKRIEPKKEKIVKRRYCSRCGSVIDNNTKACTGCGKQYFKGIKLNKFSLTVIILLLALIISVIINICQYIEIDYLSWQNELLSNRIGYLQTRVK